MSSKAYDSEQLRTIALGVLGSGWYVLTNPEHARAVIRRLLATLDERSIGLARLDELQEDRGRALKRADALTPMQTVIDHEPAEYERRSRAAYQAWTDACTRTGVSAPPWDTLLDDEKYQWCLVYDGCASDSAKFQTGPR